MNYKETSFKIAQSLYGKVMSELKPKSVSKKTLRVCNGYIIERLKPSGKFRVKSEALGCTVIVDSFKQAKKISINNSISE